MFDAKDIIVFVILGIVIFMIINIAIMRHRGMHLDDIGTTKEFLFLMMGGILIYIGRDNDKIKKL